MGLFLVIGVGISGRRAAGGNPSQSQPRYLGQITWPIKAVLCEGRMIKWTQIRELCVGELAAGRMHQPPQKLPQCLLSLIDSRGHLFVSFLRLFVSAAVVKPVERGALCGTTYPLENWELGRGRPIVGDHRPAT